MFAINSILLKLKMYLFNSKLRKWLKWKAVASVIKMDTFVHDSFLDHEAFSLVLQGFRSYNFKAFTFVPTQRCNSIENGQSGPQSISWWRSIISWASRFHTWKDVTLAFCNHIWPNYLYYNGKTNWQSIIIAGLQHSN
jgi:hypothetical protein